MKKSNGASFISKEHDQRIHNYNKGRCGRNKYLADKGRAQSYYFGEMNEETDAPRRPSWWGHEKEEYEPVLPKVYIRDKNGKRIRIK